MAGETGQGRRRMSRTQAAWLFLAPFLTVYALFLVYPFFRGIWISLHDWNLLAVAFNPEAKQFVGTRNSRTSSGDR
jgi:multiple sugar transport system permease protein